MTRRGEDAQLAFAFAVDGGSSRGAAAGCICKDRPSTPPTDWREYWEARFRIRTPSSSQLSIPDIDQTVLPWA